MKKKKVIPHETQMVLYTTPNGAVKMEVFLRDETLWLTQKIMCREVFKKFKACINIFGINDFRKDYDAINIIYRSLQKDRDEADIEKKTADVFQHVYRVYPTVPSPYYH